MSTSDLVCCIRKKRVAHTPEEHIRQNTLNILIDEGHWPSSSLAVEIALSSICSSIPKQMARRRVDIIGYGRQATETVPLLIIECKRAVPTVQSVAQVLGYHMYLRTPLCALVWDTQCLLYRQGSLWYQGPIITMPSYHDMSSIEP